MLEDMKEEGDVGSEDVHEGGHLGDEDEEGDVGSERSSIPPTP